ncbi:MAG: tetratricopeptide repeat protein [Pseudomonadota bacterium]
MKIRATTFVPLALLLASSSPVWQGDGRFSIVKSAHAQDDREAKEDGRRVLRAKDVQDVSLSDEYRKLAREKRHQSMQFLKEILSQGTAQGEQKAEMILRLADLYFEEGRDIYLDEMNKYQKAFDACFNDERCDTRSLNQDEYTTESRDWQDKSIKLYRQILANYPQYQRADEATFYLASALLDTHQEDEAVKEFTRLVRTYPESRWVPDSYVLIGEYYFEKNNAYKALVAYQKAASYRESDKYAFALYKLAWCYYNVGEYGKGIDTMKTVVAQAMSSAEAGQSGRGKIQLQDEALKDLVRFFADAGEMDEAYAYFNKLGKKELIRDMLKRLASTYFEQGKFEQCVQTYRRLIAEDPQSKDAPDYQNEIIGAYLKMGKKQETIAEIDRLLKTYGKNSAWARANASNQDALKAADNYIEKNLRKVATNYHEEARKLGTGSAAIETYTMAYKAYTVYLQEFPDSQYSYDVRYAFGELLYKIKKYDEAYAQYMKVVSVDPKGKYSEFCAESAIFASDEMLKREKKAGGAPNPGAATESIALTDWETKSLAALDQYAKLFPDSEKTKNIIYKSAYLLYNKNHFKDASDRFRVVIGMDPASKEAEQAANLILDSFNLVEDWSNLKDVAKAFYDQQGLGSQSFKSEVFNIYERASFKLIEVTFAKSNDKAVAAKAYRAFYEEFPKSEVADLALNNASVYYHDLGNLQKSMETRLILVENFQKSEYYKDQVAALGFDYESIADFENAAHYYEKLFSLDEKHASAPDALFSAALFRKSMGEWQVAIKDYEKYITAYPSRDDVNDVKLDIGKIYEENNSLAEASKVYQRFYKESKPDKVPLAQIFYARLQYGLCLKAMQQTTALTKHWDETVKEIKKYSGADLGEGVEVVAQILYEVAEGEYAKYAAMQINGPGTQKLGRAQTDKLLKTQLTDKAKALQAMVGTYTEIIGTGAGEWGVAGLVRVGQAFENFADSLKNSHVPAYLSEDQRELYLMALEDKIYPQQEKAVEAYTNALDKSFELSLYNENTAYATRRLGELRPDDFPGLEEGLLEPGYVTTHTSSSKYETEF